MFNLNDPRWGRGDDKSSDDSRGDGGRPPSPPTGDRGDRNPKSGGQPPDLDELWRDLNRKLSGFFGGKNGGGRGPGNGGGYQPDMKNAGVGVGLIAGIADPHCFGHRPELWAVPVRVAIGDTGFGFGVDSPERSAIRGPALHHT